MSLPKDCPTNEPAKKRRRRKSKGKHLEAHVVRECLQHLAGRTDVVYVERRNTGAVQFQDGGFVRFGQKGAADIWCLLRVFAHEHRCLHGTTNGDDMCCPEDWGVDCKDCIRLVHVEIECKRADGKGRLSPAQKDFRQFCLLKNIPHFVVYSVDDLEKKLQEVH